MFTINKASTIEALDHNRDTLREAVNLALESDDVFNVIITNQDTGEKIVGQQILDLAKRLESEGGAAMTSERQTLS